MPQCPMPGDATVGKITGGLASHWPCVTDFSGLSTYGLTALWEEDKHPAYSDGV